MPTSENMKIVDVTWLDHMVLEGRNIPRERIEKLKLIKMHSVGFLISEDQDLIRFSSTIEQHDEEPEFSYGFVVSKKMIVNIKVIESASKD